VRVKLAKYRSYEPCPECHGSRLKHVVNHVKFRDLTIGELFAMNVKTARRFWEFMAMSKQEEATAGTCGARSSIASCISTRSGCRTSHSIARRARFPAASRSASISPRRLAAHSRRRCT
jgi:hypothetical protein